MILFGHRMERGWLVLVGMVGFVLGIWLIGITNNKVVFLYGVLGD